jgi:hypothetical protein
MKYAVEMDSGAMIYMASFRLVHAYKSRVGGRGINRHTDSKVMS